MSLLSVLTGQQKVLRCVAKPVVDFNKKIASLTDDMYWTMKHLKGVGLAGPQVGKSLAVSVIEIPPDTSSKINFVPKLILLNPRIVKVGKSTDIQTEGCLSLPGIEVKVKRYLWVKVKAQNLDGEQFEFVAKNFFARVIQHEIDHLNGILITDYDSPIGRKSL